MKLRPAPDATVPTRPSSLLLPLILLLLLVLPQAAAAQRADAFQSRASEPAIRASERAEVEAALQQQGRARIIVEIVPEQNREPESALNEAQIQAQRARIGRDLRRFSASVEARAAQRTDPQGRPAVEIHHHFETVPYVVMTVDSAAFAHLLERDEVRNIQPDRLDEPQMDDTVGLTGASQAWTAGYTGDGQSVVIMDTGTQLDHPNLSANMETDACFSSNVSELSASSLCLNGDTERTGGNTFDCGIEDGFSPCRHGTHVAGTVAGTGSGFSGMAPDAGLIPIQVFTKFDDADICGGTAPCLLAYTSDQMKGYEYVYTTLMQTYDIAAINVSLGGGQYENTCDYDARKPLIDQLREANIATIIASGNNGSTSSGIAPGCISSAVTVGSTTKSDAISSFSNSTYYVDILAPGSSITSTVPENGFATLQGTSMATPHVSGAWALLRQKFPHETVAQLLDRLQRTGPSITDTRNGLNRTLARIQVDAALTDTPPPAAIVFEDDFETRGENGLPEGWTLSDSGNGQGWRFDNPGERTFGFGDTFAILDSDYYGDGNAQNAFLTSPPVRVGGIDAPMLSFRHHLVTDGNGTMQVQVSEDGGQTFITAFDSNNQTMVRGGTFDAPAPERFFINLGYFVSDEADELLLRWRFEAAYGWWWAIDDVNVTGGGVAFTTYAAELTGDHEGWRFLSVPANTATHADLLSNVWTQGVPGSDNPDGDINVLLYDEATNAWLAPADMDHPAGTTAAEATENAGLGLIAYIFGKERPDSETITWPKTIQASGYPFYDEISRELSRTDGGGWHLLGNPYPFPISWIKIVQEEGGAALENIRTEVFIWDAGLNDGDGGYRFNDGTVPDSNASELGHSGIIPPFQAFWLRVDDAAATGRITFKPAHEATEDGTLYRGPQENEGLTASRPSEPLSWFKTGLRAEAASADRAAVVMLNFGTEEKSGAAAPAALSEPRLSLHLLGAAHQERQMFQYLHLEPGEERIIPIAFEAAESGTYEIAAFGDAIVPPHIEVPEIHLLDAHTGAETLLFAPQHDEYAAYSFEYEAASETVKNEHIIQNKDLFTVSVPAVPFNPGGREAASSPARFMLRLRAGSPVSSGGASAAALPATVALHQNYPNPFNPATTLAYALPEAAEIRLEVFNIAGQRVALLEEGHQPAGRHQLRFDASALSSGVYLYRLQAGEQILTRRMTLIK